YWIIGELGKNIKKTNIKNDVCLHSELSSFWSSVCILCWFTTDKFFQEVQEIADSDIPGTDD
ncbi:hypothetical protein, partial [Streptococcus salivarius]